MRHGTWYAVPGQLVDEDLDLGQMLGHLDGHVRDQNGRTTWNVAGNAVDREVMRGHEAPQGRGGAHQAGSRKRKIVQPMCKRNFKFV